MGWSETLINGYTRKDTRELVRKQISPSFEILADRICGSVYYGACKDKKTGIVHAIVVLTRWRSNNTWGSWFGTKFIEENAGPVESDCPDSVLELLSPTANKYAIEWRKRCLENNKEKRRVRRTRTRLQKLERGTMIQFINQKDLNCCKPGESVTLRKISYLNHKNGKRKDIWTNGRYRWKESYIPEDFNICGVS